MNVDGAFHLNGTQALSQLSLGFIVETYLSQSLAPHLEAADLYPVFRSSIQIESSVKKLAISAVIPRFPAPAGDRLSRPI